jgi:hypothetical protein
VTLICSKVLVYSKVLHAEKVTQALKGYTRQSFVIAVLKVVVTVVSCPGAVS